MEGVLEKPKKSRSKKRSSRSKESSLEEALPGEVPDAPKLEDFKEALDKENETTIQQETNAEASSKLEDSSLEAGKIEEKIKDNEACSVPEADADQPVTDINTKQDVEAKSDKVVQFKSIIAPPVQSQSLYPTLEEIECTEAVEVNLQTLTLNELDDTVDPCEEAIALPTAPVKTESGIFFSLIPGQVADQNVSRLNEVAEDVVRTSSAELMQIIQRIRSPQAHISQISSLYTNVFIENCEVEVKEFLNQAKTAYDGYELYELLSNYQRAFNQLGVCEKSLYELRGQFSEYEKNVWTITSEKLSQEATCKDETTVEATHQYHTSKFNTDIYTLLERSLKGVKELTKDSFPLFTYSVQLCRTQIDHFFYKNFSHINLQSFEIQGYHGNYPNVEADSTAANLRKAISTLFVFVRKSSKYPSFLDDLKRWLSNCVGLLLRLATLKDHEFILQHVLRMPPGSVNKWACHFVQIPKIPIPSHPSEYYGSFSHIYLDYALAVLNSILRPVAKRDEFLKHHVSPYKSLGSDTSHQWVVIDSDGEDDHEDSTFFKESDLIALLHQIPFDKIFKRILFVYDSQGVDVYDVEVVHETNVLKLIEFTRQLVIVLGQGFTSYYTDRYRQLTKLIGRLILHVTKYVTDHVENFLNRDGSEQRKPASSVLNVEYDLFLMNSVSVLLGGKNIGTLQFLAAVPFHLIKPDILWDCYALISKWASSEKEGRPSEDISYEFENDLVAMNESDAFYLLNTLSNMAIAREGNEPEFVRIVTFHLFQIGFLSPVTRDTCSKHARDLLGALTKKYPYLISVLLDVVKNKMDILDSLSLYLMKELAFDVWKPTVLDLKLLSHWLINYSATAIESQTSRLVIQSMNWGFDDKGELFLPYEIHLKVALLVLEAYCRWMKSQGLIAESMKQVSSLAGKGQDNYAAWAWDIIMKLHLHIHDRSNNGIRLATLLRTLPTFESHPELENLRSSVAEKNPLASLLTLLITPLGHSIPLITPHGMEQLENLILNSKYEAGLHVLFFITPLFASCREALFRNEKFRGILSNILAADMTYMRMAKNLIKYDFPGYYTKLFGDMIATQIQQHDRFQTSPSQLAKLWIDCITKLENWNKDRNALHVLDIIAKFCFTREEWQTCFMEHFSTVYKELSATTQSGLASFLFSWSSSSKTLLPTPFYSSSPYFTYGILTIETTLENETGFWNSVMVSLANPKTSVDAAVKKACNSSKFTTSPNYLTIYRWGQFALELPVDHDLTFLVWQKFFTRYLFRPITGDSNQGIGVGDRFFEGMVNSAFAKKLKARIFETVEHYRNALSAVESQSVEENASENPAILIDFYKECWSVATAFSLWIEDTQMHSASLYLPALPPQFLPLRLLSVMEGCQIEWKEFVNNDEIETKVRSIAVSYATSINRSVWYDSITRRRRAFSSSTYDDRQDEIIRRLATYDQPLEPPPAPNFERIIPAIPAHFLIEPKSMLTGISVHFKNLTDYAERFSLQISQQTALDCSYCESLPELYNNFPTETIVNVRCSGTKKWGNCSGAAHVLFKFTEARLNEGVGRRIHQNRTDYEQLLNEKLVQPPPMKICVAAVFLEDIITTLVVNSRNLPQDHPERVKTSSVGAELFYRLIELIHEETNFYPPTRQLFTSSSEVLGHEFICPDSSQYKRIVNTCIAKPHLIGVLAPNINLGHCSTTALIEIYKDVINIPKKDADLAFVILTKFDISSWLRKTKPKLFERSQLISFIWKALTSEGFDPEHCPMVYDVFRNHFKMMLLYDFPQHYGEILNYLLEGSEAQIVPLLIWFDFFNCLSRNAIRFKTGMDSAMKRREIKRFATEANIIHHQELIETARLLAKHFTKERVSYGIYGLYPKYRNYIEALSCFLQLISVSIVASTLKNSKGSLSQKIVESIWPVLHDLYAPWILPYNQKTIQQQCSQWIQNMNFDSSSVLHPWVTNDSSYAIVFMNDFTDCLMFLVETLPGTGSLFSYLWCFYVENYANSGVKPHVLSVVHNCLVSVPWTIFWPNFSDVETMNRVVEKYLPTCHSFLAVIFAQVNWLEWIKHLSPSMISKGFGLLLNLTVRLANDSIARESPSWVCVMERALYQMTWESVSLSTLEPILNWFVMSIDPRVVLHLENGHHMDKAVLRLLKLASGFLIPDIPPPSSRNRIVRSDTPHKRYLFVRSYIRLLVTASSKYKQMLGTHSKNFEESVTLLMDDIVAVIQNEGSSTEEFLPQIQELVSLMSNHYLGTIARNALIGWCNAKRDAPLPVLYCLVQLSFSAKVTAYVIVPLVEAVMNLCFAHPGATWASISEKAVLNPDDREITNYFEVASKDGHFLVLHLLLMKRNKIICNGGVASINFLSDVLKNLKPKESNEEAMPLIYGNMINCCLSILQASKASQSEDAVSKHTKKFLNALALHLSLYGDDKQSWGFLGTLGLGKASQLTVNGRLFVRCLGLFILAQIPTNAAIRTTPVSSESSDSPVTTPKTDSPTPTNVKPHSDYTSGMEKLTALKLNRAYAQLEETIDFAIQFIESPSNTLQNTNNFIKQLNGFLFTGRILYDDSV